MNLIDRISVERHEPAEDVLTVFESVPCRFSFLEAIKNEQLMGAQTAQASVMIPLSFQVVEDGVSLDEYRFYLQSPTYVGNLADYMVPHTEKPTRKFRIFICQVFQHGQLPE